MTKDLTWKEGQDMISTEVAGHLVFVHGRRPPVSALIGETDDRDDDAPRGFTVAACTLHKAGTTGLSKRFHSLDDAKRAALLLGVKNLIQSVSDLGLAAIGPDVENLLTTINQQLAALEAREAKAAQS